VTIQEFPSELAYVRAQLHNRPPVDQSFLGTFCLCLLRADSQNYEFLRPALYWFMTKYPADPRRLAIELEEISRPKPGA
jgi:hypothetical protein